jgi:hypothetical protein
MDPPFEMEGFFNPLAYPEVDLAGRGVSYPPPTPESTLRFLCLPQSPSDLQSLLARYAQIAQVDRNRLHAVPSTPVIMNRLIWPLRQAKGCFMVENYLGTIALCGVVAEMISILMVDMRPVRVYGKVLDRKDQKAIFGRALDKLGQEARTRILHHLGHFPGDINAHFDRIRNARRKYLHAFDYDEKQLPADALAAYDSALTILVELIGQEVKDNQILVLNPSFQRYLHRKGLLPSEAVAPQAPGIPKAGSEGS